MQIKVILITQRTEHRKTIIATNVIRITQYQKANNSYGNIFEITF